MSRRRRRSTGLSHRDRVDPAGGQFQAPISLSRCHGCHGSEGWLGAGGGRRPGAVAPVPLCGRRRCFLLYFLRDLWNYSCSSNVASKFKCVATPWQTWRLLKQGVTAMTAGLILCRSDRPLPVYCTGMQSCGGWLKWDIVYRLVGENDPWISGQNDTFLLFWLIPTFRV
jgi:hypothetical protein